MSDPGGEFAFIERLAARLDPLPGDQVGVGDDAAVLADSTLAAVDTLVAERHFRLSWCEPEDVGWKALAVSLSDIAAMGGLPTAALAAATLPPDTADLADRLAGGLIEAAEAFDCPLVGGDTTSGPVLVISVTVLGRMAAERRPVLRSGARPDNAIYLTGPIGAAGLALDALEAGNTPDPANAAALHRPLPRLREGCAAATGGATAMIDVSDGLAADLSHILDASEVGAEVDAERLPLAPGITRERALGAGDDYELCFTAPDEIAVDAAFSEADLPTPIRIGTITDRERVVIDSDGPQPLLPAGWAHDVR